jgi:hypothetical protein
MQIYRRPFLRGGFDVVIVGDRRSNPAPQENEMT